MGIDFQIFLLFPLQQQKASLIVLENTQQTLLRAYTIPQRDPITKQCNGNVVNRFFNETTQVASEGSCHPLLWSIYEVKTFPHAASKQKKRLIL